MAAVIKQKPKPKVNHRNSEDGRFVKKEYANQHPKTTEREVRKKKDK